MIMNRNCQFERGFFSFCPPPPKKKKFPVGHRLLNDLHPKATILISQRICFLHCGKMLACRPAPKLEGQFTVFISPGVGFAILVASYDKHGLCWDYSYSRPPHGNASVVTPECRLLRVDRNRPLR